MKNLVLVSILLTLLACSKSIQSNTEKATIEAIILYPDIIKQLDNLISKEDSLANFDPTINYAKSYWISFHEYDKKCHISLIVNFNFHDNETTDGFLDYRGKIITFYDTDSKCNQGIVDISQLNKNKLEIQKILNDYNDENTLIYPHEPTHIDFELKADGKLIDANIF